MPETNANPREPRRRTWWRRAGNRLSVKLIAALLAAFVPAFGVLTTVNLRFHQQSLQAEAQTAAERVSDVIKRSTSYYMLHNDRQGLYEMIQTVAAEPDPSNPTAEPGIYDVKSGAQGTALDGSNYADW